MSSSDFNGCLPVDLLVQILARLPVKSLFRFRSVCKILCRLPFEKHFIELYFRTAPKDPILLLEYPESGAFLSVDRFRDVSPFALGFLNDKVNIRASCHGLTCCSSVRNRGVYYVCNPVTREFRVLPRTRDRPLTRCQPEYEATLVGLAFDPFSWNFNVVLAGFYRLFGHRPRDDFVCQVFDSQTNSWSRSVSSMNDEFTHMNRCQVVFSCGLLHWLTQSWSHLLVFDPKSGVWSKMSLPDEVLMTRSGSRLYLLELEGSVSVVQITGMLMSIWVLTNHCTELWTLFDTVHLRCIKVLAASIFPIGVSRDVIFMATQKKIMIYNLKDKVWKELYSVNGPVTYPLWFSAYGFRSTLFPCRQRRAL
ncbi:F-box protein At5g49610-like [Zingiber officinale]|uniref:F-box domain-containing protein n=1 Tax=Zingiber officinale TaxID=94328 RepID=A0A8J5LY95_ZINOF|nr:F-box protein At5g49610-like [Zingiber officinale]KAG6536116.1 hypothetical protein ZIOFF_001160 [Zingiber officinale]